MFWRQARGLVLIALAAGPACSLLSWRSLDAVAESYVRTTLRLAQHDPALVEDWRGPQSWRPGGRIPVAALQPEIGRLLHDLERAANDIGSSQEYARVHYLLGQVRALRFAAERLLGRSTSIDDQARDELAITLPPLDQAAITRTHDALSRVLSGTEPLAVRIDNLRRGTVVPTDRRSFVIGKALEACRQATTEVIDLPKDERVRGVFRSGLEWDAFARYTGNHVTDLEVNDDVTLDVSRALRLACHEGYPGHHVQHLIIDRLYEERQWPELLLVPGFGPHLFFLEGAAEVGADLALTASGRERLYREHLFPASGLNTDQVSAVIQVEGLLQDLLPVVTDVARQYLDSAITEERALDRLANEAFVSNPRGTLAFIERRRARALVYGEGRRVVYSMMTTQDLDGLYAAFKRAAAVQ